jgi:hypothetical protein
VSSSKLLILSFFSCPESGRISTISDITCSVHAKKFLRRGSTTHLTTTRQNPSAHSQAILFSALLRTCQDAVLLTKRVANYLWVDTLCIVQNDLEDWRMESQLMIDVYAGALLTVAATKGAHQASGCFSRLKSEV